MASTVSRKGKRTFCFFSLNFSNKAGIQTRVYISNRFFNLLAKLVKHLAAMPIIVTFVSFVIIYSTINKQFTVRPLLKKLFIHFPTFIKAFTKSP